MGWPLAVAPCGRAAGSRPLQAGRSRSCPRAVAALAGGRPLRATAPTGDRPFAGGPWLQSVAPLQVNGLCSTAPPPRCLHCENAARTRRMILRDTISSHAV
ncbi:hypothetical protein GW17_00034543 [Ensete ventricosum]|nr:hypothetical protein GW17_00034543 [Ensete ventricosum]